MFAVSWGKAMSGSGKTVTRVDLCEAVYQKVGLSRTESSAFVELVLKAGGGHGLSAEFLAGAHHAAHAAAHHLLGQAAFAHLLEHLAHLRVLAEEHVDVLHAGAGAGGDALAARAGDDLVIAALVRGHGVDDGFEADELLFIHILRGLGHSGEGADAGEHLEDRFHGAELFDLAELVAEVFEGEAVAEERLLGDFFLSSVASAFSTSERMSPMPRMRPTMRSG